MAFSTIAMFVQPPPLSSSKIFPSLSLKPSSFKQFLSVLPFPYPLATSNFFPSLWIILDIPYQWNHTICGLYCLHLSLIMFLRHIYFGVLCYWHIELGFLPPSKDAMREFFRSNRRKGQVNLCPSLVSLVSFPGSFQIHTEHYAASLGWRACNTLHRNILKNLGWWDGITW